MNDTRLSSLSFKFTDTELLQPVIPTDAASFPSIALARIVGYLYEDAEHLEPTSSFRYKEIKDSIDHE